MGGGKLVRVDVDFLRILESMVNTGRASSYKQASTLLFNEWRELKMEKTMPRLKL